MPLTNLRLASSVVEGAQILLVVIIMSMLSLGDLAVSILDHVH